MSDEPTPQPMQGDRTTPTKTSGRPWLAYIFFLAAIVLFGAAGWMYLREDENKIVVPTATAGHNEMKDVVLAFEAAGLDPEYGRSAERAIGLTEAAQTLIVDDQTVYVFVYPDVAQRERDQDRLDPAALQIVNTRGTPTAEGTPHVAAGSNVLIVTYSTDTELTAKLDAAMAELK